MIVKLLEKRIKVSGKPVCVPCRYSLAASAEKSKELQRFLYFFASSNMQQAVHAEVSQTHTSPGVGLKKSSERDLVEEVNRKGFKPRCFLFISDTKEQIDLPANPIKFREKYEKYLDRCSRLPKLNREKLMRFFLKYTLDDELRKKVWKTRIGNRLKITKASFRLLEDKLDAFGIPNADLKIISNDLDRTFPTCETKAEGFKMYQDMKKVLSLFVVFRPDVGYVQGMTSLVSMLYCHFDIFETFSLFANLVLCNKFLRDLYTMNRPLIQAYTRLFSRLVKKNAAKVHHALASISMTCESFAFDWFFTLYSRAFDVHLVQVLWDVLLVFGDFYLIHTGVVLLKILEKEISKKTETDKSSLVRIAIKKLKLSQIIELLLEEKVSGSRFDKMVAKQMRGKERQEESMGREVDMYTSSEEADE